MGSRHGPSFWADQQGSVGYKLMQNMGWSAGSGLGKKSNGSVECLRVRVKKGNDGIGTVKAGRDETWTAATSAFNDLLKRLSSGEPAPDTSAACNTTATIGKHRARSQLYGKFKRAKDTSNYSSADMNEIFGRRDKATVNSVAEDAPSSGVKTVTNKKTIEEYFQQKLNEKAERAADSQESLYMHMSAIATSGRFGLGMSCPSTSRLEDDWFPTPRSSMANDRLRSSEESKPVKRKKSKDNMKSKTKAKSAKAQSTASETDSVPPTVSTSKSNEEDKLAKRTKKTKESKKIKSKAESAETHVDGDSESKSTKKKRKAVANDELDSAAGRKSKSMKKERKAATSNKLGSAAGRKSKSMKKKRKATPEGDGDTRKVKTKKNRDKDSRPIQDDNGFLIGRQEGTTNAIARPLSLVVRVDNGIGGQHRQVALGT
ncbi:unnamed protein product (mitochondrion) [Plasmodiophora brassicae]|uniref:G-patch domain-containing protein n=1 Tax=Plasmodiophora brassicae TaxID=37360 RepID=A0A3P3Y419_PLABS|nr:unnamed protein product [Plasmodiophora brassicae]